MNPQLTFLDSFVRVYGINGLTDYQTKITCSQFKHQQFLDQINMRMELIKKHFKTSAMSLSRKKYIIDSPTLAISVLKHCLQQAGIAYEIVRDKHHNYLRLNSKKEKSLEHITNHLMDYIQQPVENISHQSSQQKNDVPYVDQIYNINGDQIDHNITVDYRKLMSELNVLHSAHSFNRKANDALFLLVTSAKNGAVAFSDVVEELNITTTDQHIILTFISAQSGDAIFELTKPTFVHTVKIGTMERVYWEDPKQATAINQCLDFVTVYNKIIDLNALNQYVNNIPIVGVEQLKIKYFFHRTEQLLEQLIHTMPTIRLKRMMFDTKQRRLALSKGRFNCYLDTCPEIPPNFESCPIANTRMRKIERVMSDRFNLSDTLEAKAIICKVTAQVVNFKGEHFDSLIADTWIQTTSPHLHPIVHRRATTDDTLAPNTITTCIPILCYSSFEIYFNFAQPLLDDQYVKVILEYVAPSDLDEDTKAQLTDAKVVVGDGCIADFYYNQIFPANNQTLTNLVTLDSIMSKYLN